MTFFPLIDTRPSCSEINTYFSENRNLLASSIDVAEYIVVWWWDGRMLDCMRKFAHLNKPFLWLNCGTRGFLLNIFDEKELCDTCSDRIDCIDARAIDVDVYFKNGEKISSYCLNDITLWWSVLDYFSFTITTKERSWTTKWTGLIVCTALWSTWYALNVSQPLIPLQSRMRWISGLATAPFQYSFAQPHEISISLSWRSVWMIWFDGYNETYENVEKVILRPSKKKVQLAFFKSQPFAEKRLLLTEEKLGR